MSCQPNRRSTGYAPRSSGQAAGARTPSSWPVLRSSYYRSRSGPSRPRSTTRSGGGRSLSTDRLDLLARHQRTESIQRTTQCHLYRVHLHVDDVRNFSSFQVGSVTERQQLARSIVQLAHRVVKLETT